MNIYDVDFLQHNAPSSLDSGFFNRDALEVAEDLLGKVIHFSQKGLWLRARIIETEAYYLDDKSSHSSLGYTENRCALFADPGTIYMYYAHGGDSLNFSCQGNGNAVLIKSGYPSCKKGDSTDAIDMMQANNPTRTGQPRPLSRLCAGQTLLCKSLGIKVRDWNNQQLTPGQFELQDDSYAPESIIQTTRLGIHPQRDAHLPYRFIDAKFARNCTKNPLRVRNWHNGQEYTIFRP